jgi:hypothetical protein
MAGYFEHSFGEEWEGHFRAEGWKVEQSRGVGECGRHGSIVEVVLVLFLLEAIMGLDFTS